MASCGIKPTIGDELSTKRSPLCNLEVACYVKLVLRFSGTRVGRWVKWPRAIYCSLWRDCYKALARLPPAGPRPTLRLPSKASPVGCAVDQRGQTLEIGMLDSPMPDDHSQIPLCFPRFTVSQIHEVVPMAVSGGEQIVSAGWVSGAKMNKDRRTGRIRVKKEREERTKT